MGEVRGQISLGCRRTNALAEAQFTDEDTDTHTKHAADTMNNQ